MGIFPKLRLTRVFSFLLQSLTWLLLAYTLNYSQDYLVLLIFCIVAYLIFCMFLSRDYSLVRNIRSRTSIYSFMEDLFTGTPYIEVTSKAFHYKTIYYREDGKTKSKKEKILTFSDKQAYEFNYMQDQSGIFTIESTEASQFISLELSLEVDFSSAKEAKEFELFYNTIEEDLKDRDDYYEISKEFVLPGLEKYSLIALNRDVNRFVSQWYMLLSFCLLLGEFYKWWLCCLYLEQDFTIKKKVARFEAIDSESRWDLNRCCGSKVVVLNRERLHRSNSGLTKVLDRLHQKFEFEELRAN